MNCATAIDAEDEFYRAFAHRDVVAMISLWAADGRAVCVHPGAEAISGHAPIAESWRDILGDDGYFDITHQRLSRLEDGELAVHTGIERIRADDRSALLTVTNVFRKTGDGWKIFLHHAAPIHNLSTAEGAVH